MQAHNENTELPLVELPGEKDVGELALSVVGKHLVVAGGHDVVEVVGARQPVHRRGQRHHATPDRGKKTTKELRIRLEGLGD